MSPEEVTTHKAFDFWQLYFGDGQIYSSFEKFDEMENRHEKVHTIAKDIVSFGARGEQEKAATLLEDFKEARFKMFVLLDDLFVS